MTSGRLEDLTHNLLKNILHLHKQEVQAPPNTNMFNNVLLTFPFMKNLFLNVLQMLKTSSFVNFQLNIFKFHERFINENVIKEQITPVLTRICSKNVLITFPLSSECSLECTKHPVFCLSKSYILL